MERLVEYVQDGLAAGMTAEQLRDALISAGHPPHVADQAIAQASTIEPRRQRKFMLLLISVTCFTVAGILIILLALYVAAPYFGDAVERLQTRPQTPPEPHRPSASPTNHSIPAAPVRLDDGCTSCLAEAFANCTPSTIALSKNVTASGEELTLHYTEEILGAANGECSVRITLDDVDAGMMVRLYLSNLVGESMTCTAQQNPVDTMDAIPQRCAGPLLEAFNKL